MSERQIKASFVPLYNDIVPAVVARCGASALGCFCVLARKADFGAGWTVSAGLRDMAAWCGLSVNTLKTKILAPLEEAGFIRVDSPDRQKTLVTLTVMNDVENGKSVSKFDTDEKNFAKKNKTVSKLDTDKNGFAALFPQFVVRAGENGRFPIETLGNDVRGAALGNDVRGAALANDGWGAGHQTIANDEKAENGLINRLDSGSTAGMTAKTVSNFDTEAAEIKKTVSNSDTVQTVSNFDTAAPSPHLSPIEVINNNLNNIYTKTETKKNNFSPSLEEVRAYFAEKNYVTDPEDFFNKNEARNWTWCDRAGKTHKIKNWKATAYEFEKRTKASGRVNFNNPQKNEEKLFCWYYGLVCPEVMKNETARDNRWAAERGYFAFIASVAGDLETGKQIVLRGTEQLEKGGFSASVKAVSNRALQLKEEISKGGK